MRKIWDIHGGIHPPENKLQSMQKRIEHLPIPKKLIFPLSQHIGAPAKPVVNIGDKVLKGQKIAEKNGFVSAAIHASSSGTIIAIEDHPIPHASGLSAPCIIVETDGEDRWIAEPQNRDWKALSEQEIVNLVAEAGITGMGGAGFPSNIKLTPKDISTIDTLIINGTECEPYITADHALMLERNTQLIEGIEILAKVLSPSTILVGVENNKLDAAELLRQAVGQSDRLQALDSQVVTFPTKYPSGGEKQLIQILTGKEVPSGKLPSDLGIVCHNMGTTVAIRDAVIESRPLISRITTVTGDAMTDKGNIEVLLGTPIIDVLEQRGFQQELNERVIMGGPMMGFSILSLSSPVIKTTNCLLAPLKKELPIPPPAKACIRCGMCAEACPASLLPQQLYWFSKGNELDKLEQHNLFDCIECGACSYVCPSNIPLVQYYRASKADIKQRDADMLNAEKAKERFEARVARLERLEEEKKAAKLARQKKAAANKAAKKGEDPKAAAIKAAMARVAAKKSERGANTTTSAKGENVEVNVETATVTQKPVESNDPIAKAMAAREAAQNAPAQTPLEKAEKDVQLCQQRLEKANTRLKKAEEKDDPNISAFKAAVSRAEEKLATAKSRLQALPGASTETSSKAEKAATDPKDPIARAIAAREAAKSQPALSPLEKAEKDVELCAQRLEKARARLVNAEEKDDPNVSAFNNAFSRAKDKLAAAESTLQELKG